MRSIWWDIRYAFRVLGRNPGFAAIPILTLSLGIGSNTAIFSIFNGVLLRPLAFSDPDRLIAIQEVVFNADRSNTIAPVGFYAGGKHGEVQTHNNASPYGAYDMAGNLLEWCSDWYGRDYYSVSPPDKPQGAR